MQSWQDAPADGRAEPEEVGQQWQRVTNMLRSLEPKLHEELTTISYGLSVLYGMRALVQMTLQGKGE